MIFKYSIDFDLALIRSHSFKNYKFRFYEVNSLRDGGQTLSILLNTYLYKTIATDFGWYNYIIELRRHPIFKTETMYLDLYL